MRRPQAIFFDLDGTLVDTERLAVTVIERHFFSRGVKIPSVDLDFIVGKKWRLGVEFLLSRYPLGDSVEMVENEILSSYRQQLKTSIEAIPGAPQFVRALFGKYQLACVSGSHLQDIGFALERFGIRDCFSTLVGCEDYKASKPSPEAYLTALSRLGLKPNEVWVFEDSVAGMTSALAAGVQVIQVGMTAHVASHPLHLRKISDFHDSVIRDWLLPPEATT